MTDARRIVGIDLGTTNSAVAWAETRVAAFPVEQLVGEGELGARATLPSFVYLAGEHDLPPAATRLPWDPGSRIVVGELARTQGARVPGRMVASSKSWLCHPGVDRKAAILPWGVADGEFKISPVQAATLILKHAAAAWKHTTGRALETEEVVVTVPASFDEVARELTLEGATSAGLSGVTLLEEPQAVFYAWIDAHDPIVRRKTLAPGHRVLVCDVGGGTTDFTLIEVAGDGDTFERTATGDHVLLGGDNIDIALARKIEARLGVKIDAVQWHGLVHACRLAKEQILSDETIATRPITVAARGSRLIGGVLKSELGRAEVLELVVDGFFPLVDAAERPARARAGLHEFGLPYAADAGITRHLAAFLARHGSPKIDALLFNGGAMKPAVVRARVLDQIARWQDGTRPRELENVAPELAVAHGAAYYGLVRRGLGARIRGGAARAYFVGVENGKAVCVLPRGAEEGTERDLGQDLIAVTNRPASFRLYSSSSGNDQPGDVVGAADVAELPPLVTVLRAPGRKETRVRVRARLTEIGTVEIWCVDADSDARWRLTFDLRASGAAQQAVELPPQTDAAKALIAASFERGAPEPAALVKELERVLESRRDEWSTTLIRSLWDGTYQAEAARARSPDVEARWLNLAGFLMRPGNGAMLDDWRVKEMWKVFNGGLRHDRDEACRLAWWILWRRIAAGLSRGQQDQFYDRLAQLFVPATAAQKAKSFKQKPSPQEAAEMWRTLGAMERLLPPSKVKLGEALLERLERGKDGEVGFWALGRLGARAPLYGPANTVVPPEIAARWIDRLLAFDWKQPEKLAFPAAQIGRRTGDRARDVDDATRARLIERLRASPGGDRTARLVDEVVALDAREERVAFGDSLPTGLRRADTDTDTD